MSCKVLLHVPGACAVAEPGCSSEWASSALHLAVSRGCCEADVLTILQADPSAALDFGGDERQTPLQVRLALCELPPAPLACRAQGSATCPDSCLLGTAQRGGCGNVRLYAHACSSTAAASRAHDPLSHPASPHPSVLQLAIRVGRLDLVQLLIPASNPSDVTGSDCTPLHTAVRCQSEAAVQLLLQAAPELVAITSEDEPQCTPLCEAAAAGCTSIVQLMLEAAPGAATASSGDDDGWLPIHAAAEGGHVAVAQLLLAAAPDTATAATEEESPMGAPPDSTPLHLAASRGHVSTVQLLLASTAPAAALAADDVGRFPAHCAFAARSVAALGVLLQAAPSAASMARYVLRGCLPGWVRG